MMMREEEKVVQLCGVVVKEASTSVVWGIRTGAKSVQG